jgi:hypothetical protein
MMSSLLTNALRALRLVVQSTLLCFACTPKQTDKPPATAVANVPAASLALARLTHAPVSVPAAKAPAPETRYRCTLIVGLTVTQEWFGAGFEDEVPNQRWQARLRPHTFVDDWANPEHEAWREPVVSPCADRPESPDRVLVFVANWTLPDAAAWKEPLARLIRTVHEKFPALRRLELLTMLRAPQNQSCGDPKSVVEPYIDQALREAAAAAPGLVQVGPALQVPSCDVFEKGGPHFNASGRIVVAKLVARAYAEQ